MSNQRCPDHLVVVRIQHFVHVPQLHRLVFAVRNEVVPVPLGRYAGHPRLMTAQTTHLPTKKGGGGQEGAGGDSGVQLGVSLLNHQSPNT